MEEPKRSIASVLLLAVFLAGHTQAAPFDEKAKAPRVSELASAAAKLEAHFATFQRKQQDPDPAAFIRDRARAQAVVGPLLRCEAGDG